MFNFGSNQQLIIMKQIKYIFFLIVIFLMTGCAKTKNELNPLIVGDWQLIEVYGPKAGSTVGWFTIQASPIQTIKFNSNGEYALAADGNITCNGSFVFEGNNSIKLKPSGCMPLIESLETIYTLTHDTLTISNKSNSISSFSSRKDKYLRIN